MTTPAIPETTARQVLMLRAFETAAPDSPLWTREDGVWASRLARQTLAEGAPAEQFVAERARHAMERLAPRDPHIRRWMEPGAGVVRHWPWAVAVGLVVGMLADAMGGAQHIDLLSPPLWGLLAWNIGIYLLLAWRAVRPETPHDWLRRLVRRLGQPARGQRHGALRAFALDWTRLAAPLAATRTALFLHLAAATLAAGMVAGMYLRGLVLDYRAGWQSTFLDASTVHALLATLLAPASAVTGIAVPDAAALETLRISADTVATADAAPWIHLYAAMLALFVIAPRILLALWSAWRGWRLSRRWQLPWDEPYFQQLMREYRGQRASVQVIPHGTTISAPAALHLRTLLLPVLGEDLDFSVAEPVAYGDEETAVVPAEPGTTLRLVLFDLGATPEPEAHGRLIARLRGPAAMAIIADEAAFARRFAAFPERLAERRLAWQRFADAEQLPCCAMDLEHPDAEQAGRALAAALTSG